MKSPKERWGSALLWGPAFADKLIKELPRPYSEELREDLLA